jgi:hypothetical protein
VEEGAMLNKLMSCHIASRCNLKFTYLRYTSAGTPHLLRNMSVTVNVPLTIPLKTFSAVRESSCPEENPEIVNQVAYDTTYTVINTLKGGLYDINIRPTGDIHCRAPRMITVKIMKLSDGKYFTCDILSNATGRELACKIHDDRNIPMLKQVLMAHGVVLFRRDADRSIDLRLDQVSLARLKSRDARVLSADITRLVSRTVQGLFWDGGSERGS